MRVSVCLSLRVCMCASPRKGLLTWNSCPACRLSPLLSVDRELSLPVEVK